MGATPKMNRSAKGGVRSSLHYGDEGVLIHPIAPRCLRTARYGRTACDLRRTGRVFGVRMLRWISSLSEIPVHHHPRILAARPNRTDASKVHTDVALFLHLANAGLRKSCMREIRTCRLSGGRRPARKRASSDPTVKKRGNARGAKGAGHPRPNQYGQLETGGTERLGRKAAAFTGWHEPCDWRQSRTVL